MASLGAWARGGLTVLLVTVFLLVVAGRRRRGVREEAKRAARAGAEVLASTGGAAGAAGAALLLDDSEALKTKAEEASAEDTSGLNGAGWKAAKEGERKKHGFWKFVILLNVCIIAHFYRTYRHHGLGERTAWATQLSSNADAGFAYGPWELSGCLREDRTLLFCSCCCLCVQWADTLSSHKLHLGKFWPLLLFSATFVIGEWKVFRPHFLLVLLAVYYRQRIRAAYGLPSGTPQTYLADCLLWCCCGPCAALQEARQVEHVPLSRSPKSSQLSAELFGATSMV
mmetsp:Transcript_95300/g.253143  ORF Transcript_95300/g.253143 Transcript_95300/m.253143 type:complete len:284 (-) Transcript_95300:55-906(-)